MRFLLVSLVAVLPLGCNTFYDADSAPLESESPDEGGSDAPTATDGGGGCLPETDGALCVANDAQCGALVAEDRCDVEREVDCGECPSEWTCGLKQPNVCGCECEADGACLGTGARHPDGSCRVCASGGWEVQTDLACSDGDLCTIGDACEDNGSCVGVPLDCSGDDCSSGGECDPQTGACIYEPEPDGEPCADDGLDCTVDVCMGGACVHQRADFTCVIDGACVPDGMRTGAAECQGCNIGDDPFRISPLPDGASCAGGTGTCANGGCLF